MSQQLVIQADLCYRLIQSFKNVQSVIEPMCKVPEIYKESQEFRSASVKGPKLSKVS